MKQAHLIIGATLSLAVSASAHAAALTAFENAMRPGLPTDGWSFLTNNTAPIGNSAAYTPLIAVPDAPTYWYDNDGIRGLPGPNPGSYVYLGAADGGVGGHPGRGTATSADGLSHYAIVAYTFSTATPVSIASSLLTNVGTSLDGLDLRVYVNDELKIVTETAPGLGSSTNFNGFLGDLSAGTTVYVAIGAKAYDNFDAFRLNLTFTNDSPNLAVIPEPASIALGLVALPLIRRNRR